jgi:outer membrane protein
MLQRIMIPVLALVAATALSTGAMAQDPGDWLVRIGVSHVDTDTDSGDLSVGGSVLPGAQIKVGNDTQPTINVSYMLTRHVAIETLAALPFKHAIKGDGILEGAGQLGSTKHLPPTVSLQYHLRPNAPLRPYVGIGLNYTTFFSSSGTDALDAALGGPSSLSIRDSFGLALQVGADFAVNDWLFFNLDLRYVQIEADARITTQTNTGEVNSRIKADIDPLVLSAGVGFRF